MGYLSRRRNARQPPLAAADLAGASSIIAIVPSPLGVQSGTYNSAKILEILGRSVEILMDEQQLNDYAPHRDSDAR